MNICDKVRAVPACRLLHPLIAIQDAFEQLSHEGFEMGVRGLADHPVGVAAEGPAGDGADQSFLVTQTLNEVGDELRQVRHHALHAAWEDVTDIQSEISSNSNIKTHLRF